MPYYGTVECTGCSKQITFYVDKQIPVRTPLVVTCPVDTCRKQIVFGVGGLSRKDFLENGAIHALSYSPANPGIDRDPATQFQARMDQQELEHLREKNTMIIEVNPTNCECIYRVHAVFIRVEEEPTTNDEFWYTCPKLNKPQFSKPIRIFVHKSESEITPGAVEGFLQGPTMGITQTQITSNLP